MRIWSVHPHFLDRQGLVACWRETLLAQKVLAGGTRGYTRHPQLERFRATKDPLAMIGAHLSGLHEEATARGYRFDSTKILLPPAPGASARMAVTDGQLAYEWAHLGAKLQRRSPADLGRWGEASPRAHPLFRVEPGPIATWERPDPPSARVLPTDTAG